jgi:hypothetical protein
MKSRFSLAPILLLLLLLATAPAPAAGIVSGTTGAGGSGSGSGGTSGGNVAGDFQVWEDFETAAPTTMAGLLARRQNAPLSIPDRQPQSKYPWYGTSGNLIVSGLNASNVTTVANGEWSFDVMKAIGLPDTGGGGGSPVAYHLYASNTFAGSVGLGWSRIHGTFMYTNSGAPNGAQLNAAMILGPANCMFSPGVGQEASPQNDFIHIQFTYDSCSAARGASGTDYMIREVFPSILAAGVEYDVDVQCVSNTCFMKVGPYCYSGTHSNLSLWSGPLAGVIADWELFGGTSNTIKFVWKSIGAGYAQEWAYALAQGNKAVGTNFQSAGRVVYKPTLTTNTYLLGQNDGIVINGLATSLTTLVTNKLPYLTTSPAATITIADGTTTAAGSNIWILTIDGTKINNATTATNIAVNNGSYTFVATPTGWQIVAKQ